MKQTRTRSGSLPTTYQDMEVMKRAQLERNSITSPEKLAKKEPMENLLFDFHLSRLEIMNEQEEETKSEVASVHSENNSLFQKHLQHVYQLPQEEAEQCGVDFFETCGYYDANGTNTIERSTKNSHYTIKSAFLDYSGLKTFWVSQEPDDDETSTISSSLFAEEEEEMRLEFEYERVSVARAEKQISQEKNEFKEHFRRLCSHESMFPRDIPLKNKDTKPEDPRKSKHKVRRSIRKSMSKLGVHAKKKTNQFSFSQHGNPLNDGPLHFPSYHGDVLVLKNGTSMIFTSWHKRWCNVDLSAGKISMFKRRWWKHPVGDIQLGNVAKVYKLNRTDFQLEYIVNDAPCSMLLRSKAENVQVWVELINFGRSEAQKAVEQFHNRQRITKTSLFPSKAAEALLHYLERQVLEAQKSESSAGLRDSSLAVNSRAA